MKGLFTTLSASLLCLSLAYLGWYGYRTSQNGTRFFSLLMAAPCKHPLVQAQLSPSIMSESESRVLTLTMNPYGRPDLRGPGEMKKLPTKPCVATVEFLAPAFDYAPSNETQRFRLGPKDENRTTEWVIAPKHRGQQSVVIKGGLDTIYVPITVVTDMGLTASQWAWACAIGAAAGFVGVLLSIKEAIGRLARF